jgi:Putative transposase
VVIDAPLSVREAGFSLHAATRAGRADEQGRQALLKYILRPPLASERLLRGPDGLVRIALKKPFSDGTVAVDLDPLSLLCRLVALVPAPRFHTVRYFGVLAPAAKWRPLIVPKAAPSPATVARHLTRLPRAALRLAALPARTTALGPSCSGKPSRPMSRPVPAAAGACACWRSSQSRRACKGSCATEVSPLSHPLALRRETRPTSRPSSSDAAPPQSAPSRGSCSRSTEP